MSRLLGVLMLAAVCTGCVSQARPAHRVERPDPIVGDLRCAKPTLTLLEALYYVPSADAQATACDPG
jgi:hypothetical protein